MKRRVTGARGSITRIAGRRMTTKVSVGLSRDVLNSFWVTFKDPLLEHKYVVQHSQRMQKGFLSSVGTRAGIYCGLAFLFVFGFEGGVSRQFASMSCALACFLFDLALICVFLFGPRNLFEGDSFQVIAAVEATVEACGAMLGTVMIKHADPQNPKIAILMRQWMVIGVLMIWLPAVFSNQKQSFLRYPYCMLALFFTSVGNIVFNIFLHQGDRSGAYGFVGVGVALGIFLCLINSRHGDYSDRSLFMKIQRIELQQTKLKKQINTANKLARTVIAMTDEDEEADQQRNENSLQSSGNGSMSTALDFPSNATSLLSGGIKKPNSKFASTSSFGSFTEFPSQTRQQKWSDSGSMARSTTSSQRVVTRETRDHDIVAEFEFFETMAQKVKLSKTVPPARELIAKVPAMKSLDSALRNMLFKRGFRYFCYSEMSIENLIFHDQVTLFKRRQVRHAKRILDTFIRPGSPSEVNINSKNRENAVKAMERALEVAKEDAERRLQHVGATGRSSASSITVSHQAPRLSSSSIRSTTDAAPDYQRGALTVDVFDDAEEEVFKMMAKDSFERFNKSPLARGLMLSTFDSEWKQYLHRGLTGQPELSITPSTEKSEK